MITGTLNNYNEIKCHDDKLRCQQAGHSWRHDNFRFSAMFSDHQSVLQGALLLTWINVNPGMDI